MNLVRVPSDDLAKAAGMPFGLLYPVAYVSPKVAEIIRERLK